MRIVSHLRRRRLRVLGWLATQISALAAAAAFGLGASGSWLWTLLPIATLVGWHPWMRREGGVPVLMYHSVSANPSWLPGARDLSVSVGAFKRQLEILARKGFEVLSTAALTDLRQNAGALPRRPVVLHFDDGYLDNWVAAYPMLDEFGFQATFFVSIDFIGCDPEARPTLSDVTRGNVSAEDLRWDGYMSWTELERLEGSGLIAIESHGEDHGRVAAGPSVVDIVQAENWRQHAWLQWAAMAGSKTSWYLTPGPPAMPVGSPVLESGPSLSTLTWTGDSYESPERLEERTAEVLRRSRETLESRLAKRVRFFCWPENAPHPDGGRLVREAGYAASGIGPVGENRVDEDPGWISRVHVGDSLLGFQVPALDDLAFYAKLRVHQGNYYWFLLLAPLHLVKRVAKWINARPFGAKLR